MATLPFVFSTRTGKGDSVAATKGTAPGECLTPYGDRAVSARGIDTARLLLRAVVGGTMIAHGIRHARALNGTARWFGSIGFRQPELQARTSAAVEISAGAALLTGAATPAAAAAVIGTMAVAGRAVHLKNGYFIVDEGYEYVLFPGRGRGCHRGARPRPGQRRLPATRRPVLRCPRGPARGRDRRGCRRGTACPVLAAPARCRARGSGGHARR
jgi:uncharacterized membrane protein YphA (DoxX/SURF4 family)